MLRFFGSNCVGFFDQVQILIGIYSKIAFTFKTQIVYSHDFTKKRNTIFFVNTHLEAAVKYMLTKHRTKSRVPWETLAVREKCADMKTASKCNRKNPTDTKALKLKKAQNELATLYLKEQTRVHRKSER